MIDKEMAEAIVKAEPSWISISVDGLEENYRKIRTPANKKGNDYNAFRKVQRNIEVLVSYRDKRGKKRPQIRTNTIFPPIAKDPMEYYQFMKDIGVDWVTINEILDFRGENLPEEAVLENWACQYPFQRLTVSANGCIIPCTGAHNEEDEMVLGRYPGTRPKEITVNKKQKMLSYPEKTLKDAWHSEALEEIRLLQKENRRRDILACRNCRHGAAKHGVEWIPDDWNMETMEWEDGIWRE
jgi:sulfatase maturation enzyme AslB (radical SAM superfamily)